MILNDSDSDSDAASDQDEVDGDLKQVKTNLADGGVSQASRKCKEHTNFKRLRIDDSDKSDSDVENMHMSKRQKLNSKRITPRDIKEQQNMRYGLGRQLTEHLQACANTAANSQGSSSSDSSEEKESPKPRLPPAGGLKKLPSLARLGNSPQRRKSIYEAPEFEELLKTPEASRKGSDKTPDSLEAGRRRLSVSLFGKLESSLRLFGSEDRKAVIKSRYEKKPISPLTLVDDDEQDVFTNVPKKLSEALSSPARSSKRTPKNPQRYSPEPDVSPTKASKIDTTPKKSTPGRAFKTHCDVKQSVVKSSGYKSPARKTNGPEQASTPTRSTPKRAASLKKKKYLESDDEETLIDRLSISKKRPGRKSQ